MESDSLKVGVVGVGHLVPEGHLRPFLGGVVVDGTRDHALGRLPYLALTWSMMAAPQPAM